MKAQNLSAALRGLANPATAERSQHFCKTGKGEYGEGDIFLGIRVPVLRRHAKEFLELSLPQVLKLLKSQFHEERLCALFILVGKFGKANNCDKEKIYSAYLKHTKYVNNWDLVDSSAHYIVGAYLDGRDKQAIYALAESDSLWERRIAIISTFFQIKRENFDDALAISEKLKYDEEDLIHKAVGWMLREIGKRNLSVEKQFLIGYLGGINSGGKTLRRPTFKGL